jgi:hypothetical protein
MDPAEIDAAWAEGERMTLEEAVELGRDVVGGFATGPVGDGGSGRPPS